MEFCITFLDLAHSPDGVNFHRYHVKDRSGKVLTFKSQRSAYKWIVKHGIDIYSYSVDPYHDMEADHAVR